MNSKEFQERLIDFAVLVIVLSKNVIQNDAGRTLTMQMIWSSTSNALNYGEATGAESPRDFIHKMQIVLKCITRNLGGITNY